MNFIKWFLRQAKSKLIACFAGVLCFVLGSAFFSWQQNNEDPEYIIYLMLIFLYVVFFVYKWLCVLYELYKDERTEIWNLLKK